MPNSVHDNMRSSVLSLVTLFATLQILGNAIFCSALVAENGQEGISALQYLMETPRERLDENGKSLPHSAIVDLLQQELNEIGLLNGGQLHPKVTPVDGSVLALQAGDRACWRNALARHARVPSKSNPCDLKHEVVEDGICYEKCVENQQGVGPLCLSRCRCKLTYTSLFFCCDSKDVCTELTTNLFTRLPLALVQFIVDISSNPADVQKVVEDFRNLVDTVMGFLLPLCDDEFTQNCAKPSYKDVLTSSSVVDMEPEAALTQ